MCQRLRCEASIRLAWALHTVACLFPLTLQHPFVSSCASVCVVRPTFASLGLCTPLLVFFTSTLRHLFVSSFASVCVVRPTFASLGLCTPLLIFFTSTLQHPFVSSCQRLRCGALHTFSDCNRTLWRPFTSFFFLYGKSCFILRSLLVPTNLNLFVGHTHHFDILSCYHSSCMGSATPTHPSQHYDERSVCGACTFLITSMFFRVLVPLFALWGPAHSSYHNRTLWQLFVFFFFFYGKSNFILWSSLVPTNLSLFVGHVQAVLHSCTLQPRLKTSLYLIVFMYLR